MRKLGYTANRGNSFKGLKDYLIENNIDFSHFLGKAHGTTNNTKYSLEEIMIENSTYSNMTKFKSRLIRANLIEYKCSCCGITEWNGKPLTLQLHHINGNNRDNRLENLTFLCPNCHSQTDNYCNNIKIKNKYFCLSCGKEILKNSKYCFDCYLQYRKDTSKFSKISKEEFIKISKEYSSITKLASYFKVSDTAIKKWCIQWNIPTKIKELHMM